MEIKLDKLEENILESLKEETGKSEEDIIKLALYELERKMTQDRVQRAQPQQPITIPVPYPVYPEPVNPYPVYPNPITPYPGPTYPYPWDTGPWQPYTTPYVTWCSNELVYSDKTSTYADKSGTYVSIDTQTTTN